MFLEAFFVLTNNLIDLLFSAMTMLVCIALFHGKNHMMRRRPFLRGHNVPLSDIIEDARMYYYGWSFVLAWICVVLCFVHTWMWLCKAQTMSGRRKIHAIRSMRLARANTYLEDDVLTLDHYGSSELE